MIWVEIVCDTCNDNSFGERYSKGSIKRLKDATKLCGWKVINGKLYCPKCQRKIKEAKNESAD